MAVRQMTPVQTNEDILRGAVEVVTHRNVENGFCVLQLAVSPTKRVTVVGSSLEIATANDIRGIEYEIRGRWIRSPKFGKQFEATQFTMLTDEIYFFLCKFTKGIGAKTAKLILKELSSAEVARILNAADSSQLLEVKGIGARKLEMIKNSWVKHRHLRDLSAFFTSRNVHLTPQLLMKIFREFGQDATTLLTENPYKLTEIRGIGFRRADYLAMQLGLPWDSALRISATIRYLLLQASEEQGHTVLEHADVIRICKELLSPADTDEDRSNQEEHAVLAYEVDEHRIESELQALVEADAVRLLDGTSLYGLPVNLVIEADILARLQRKTVTSFADYSAQTKSFLQQFEARVGYELSSDQVRCLQQVSAGVSSVSCLAGYAGTGKTTLCTAILDFLKAHHCSRDEIVCCAFTGMASARIRDVTGYESKTLHSLLGFSGESFRYNEQNPLPYKVIVLDEASMVNLYLFWNFVKAIPRDAVLLIVGDNAQLPPIGAGNVFSDLVQQQLVPTTTLTKIYRQSEDSVLTLFANEIRNGICPKESYRDGWADFEFRRVEPEDIRQLRRNGATDEQLADARERNNLAILSTVRSIVLQKAATIRDIVTDLQVLTPVRRGILGTDRLNATLQELLNPARRGLTEVEVYDTILRVGDKVVHLVNKDMEVMESTDWHRRPSFRSNDSIPTRVFNGSLGRVLHIDILESAFFVDHTDGRVVRYDIDDFSDLIEHAFALTIHKSQGSQYADVVLPMSNSHFMMLNNQLLYTAITRAISKVTLIGQPFAYTHSCNNTKSAKRLTYLSQVGNLLEAAAISTIASSPATLTPASTSVSDARSAAALPEVRKPLTEALKTLPVLRPSTVTTNLSPAPPEDTPGTRTRPQLTTQILRRRR